MGKIKLNTRRRGLLSVLSILGLVIGFFAAVGVISTTATAAEGDCDDPTLTETETVMTDPGSEAIPGQPGFWANFQPNDAQAPFTGPPSYPNDPQGGWIVHNNNEGPGQDQSGVYVIGNPDIGGNWFYRQQEVAEVPAVPPTFEEVTKEVPNPNFPCVNPKPPPPDKKKPDKKKPPTEITINKPDKQIKITEEGERVVTTFDGPMIEEGL